MNAYAPVLDNNGNIKEEFNLADFQRGSAYATLNDLLNYANLYSSNLFFGLNYFATDITFGTYINNISVNVFNYLLNCRSNIQDQFDKLNIKQKINKIINSKMTSNDIKSTKITAYSVNCETIHSSNLSYIIFFNQNVPFPVIQSGTFTSLNSFKNDMPTYVTVYPGFSLLIQNINRVPLFAFANRETEIKHYINIGSYSGGNLPYFFIISKI
jgi:hypothetical protein